MRPGRVRGRSPPREGLRAGARSRTRPSNPLGAGAPPGSRCPQGASLATQWGHCALRPGPSQGCVATVGENSWPREGQSPRAGARAPPEGPSIFAAHPWGAGQARTGPRTLTLEAAERGQPGPVRREGSQVWSWGGARSERAGAGEAFRARDLGAAPEPGSPGGEPRGRKRGPRPGLPSPRSRGGGRQLRSRFWEGKEVSDCTPPTGVRWAARDGGSEVEVKSPAGLAATPAVFWVGGGGRGGGGVCLFKEE